MIKNNRLPRNFHNTFRPERQYLNAMLRFAASGKSGDYQKIALDTGIPMGTSSGKVPAILGYCRGMGLITLSGSSFLSHKVPELTPFGRIVLAEDPFMTSGVTQWIAHLHLCDSFNGAEVWHQTFFKGSQFLGPCFDRTKLISYLATTLDVKANVGIIGPMVGTYGDSAALSNCGVLTEVSGVITRVAAPVHEEFAYGYGAWLLNLIEDYCDGASQVSVVELDTRSGWRTIPGWSISEHSRVLEMVERKGIIEVDRHMEPWLIYPKSTAESVWGKIYDDLI